MRVDDCPDDAARTRRTRPGRCPRYHPRMHEQTDILIVGGGLVGASLAIALEASDHRTSLVEARVSTPAAQPRGDERNLALARASVNGLRALGVWPHAEAYATAIRRVHVSRAGEFGAAHLDAARCGVDALGWTLPASRLGAALATRLDACTRLRRHAPAQVEAIARVDAGWRVHVRGPDGERDIVTRLLVGADGSQSSVREQVGIRAAAYDYQQTLIVSSVALERPLHGLAYERFTDAGPVALLPLAGGRAGVVLAVAADEARSVPDMPDGDFLDLAQQRFGWRQGRMMRPGRRFVHPIGRVTAGTLTAWRAVVVGNAAQTIHPIGAQGFNLGLRDALTLAELVAAQADPGQAGMLATYARRRAPDREAVMTMSHGLVRLACLGQPWLAPLRTLGLLAIDRLPPLRDAIVQRGMGFRGRPPLSIMESA